MCLHKNEIRFHPPSGRVEPQRGEGRVCATIANYVVSLGLVAASLVLFASDSPGQERLNPVDESRLTIERIFGDEEFKPLEFGPFEWLEEGDGYTTAEPVDSESDSEVDIESPAKSGASSEEKGKDEEESPVQIVRYDCGNGQSTVLVSAAQLTPPGSSEPLEIEDYDWSHDKSKVLLFSKTVKVWRKNTRGDYWVLDVESQTLRKIGGGARPSTLMFAKFSPDASRVAYVRENNIYVESLQTGETIALTTDGTKKLINGTFDWVYEEEFDLRDGFRWSPDGRRIAYWQLDSNGIRDFYLINNTDDLYPKLTPLPYPKVGTTNSACRIGVALASGGETTWMDIPGDPRDNYLATMEWVADSSALLIEQLNRLQNHRILWRTDASSGKARTVFEDRDDAWVDMRQKFDWYKSTSHRLVLSERDGWRHAYLVHLETGALHLITPGEFDVVDPVGMDKEQSWLYFTASPHSAIEQFLYRVRMDGSGMERLTPENSRGFHAYDVSPNGAWAVHTASRLDSPPAIELVSLPAHQTVRELEPNREVKGKLDRLHRGPLEFFRITIDAENKANAESHDKLELDGWLIKPPDFDASKKYPILFYVYTEPWGQTARDAWGRERFLWHLLLSQRGYIIATVDNRGTPAPRGRAWRKAIYRQIGIVNVEDQAAAARQIVAWPFVDENRVGVWGWSGGGSMTLNAMFQHPEIYHVGMSVAPVGDQRLYDSIYQERYMGLPDENEQGFTQGSPVTHAKNLQGKLLLVHGTGDDNVHYQNSEIIINELIRHNRPFDMMSYPNRSHSIKEGDGTRQHLFELLTRYLTTHLAPGPQ